jgi:hemolysin activation/secretion protein
MASKRIRRLAAWLAAASAGVSASPGAGQPAADEPTAEALVRIDTATFAEIAVVGSSVLEPDELEALTSQYENRPISFETLQTLRQDLSRLYIERGYVTSGVLIPDQTANDRVVLQAVEGQLTSVVVEGNRRFSDGAIERRAAYYLDTPLNIADLQRGLHSLQNDPLVERINAELEPGARLGESTLRVGVTERRPLELAVFAGNDRAASIGENHGTIGLTYRGLVGNGDALSGRFGGTDGAHDNALQYHVPLAPGGMALDLAVSRPSTRPPAGRSSIPDNASCGGSWASSTCAARARCSARRFHSRPGTSTAKPAAARSTSASNGRGDTARTRWSRGPPQKSVSTY